MWYTSWKGKERVSSFVSDEDLRSSPGERSYWWDWLTPTSSRREELIRVTSGLLFSLCESRGWFPAEQRSLGGDSHPLSYRRRLLLGEILVDVWMSLLWQMMRRGTHLDIKSTWTKWYVLLENAVFNESVAHKFQSNLHRINMSKP